MFCVTVLDSLLVGFFTDNVVAAVAAVVNA